MRTVLARQERMGPHAMGLRVLSRHTWTAVRKLWPQLMAKLSPGIVGLERVKSEMISAGGFDVCAVRLVGSDGIAME